MRLQILISFIITTLVGCGEATNQTDTDSVRLEVLEAVERSLKVNPPMTGNIDFSDSDEFGAANGCLLNGETYEKGTIIRLLNRSDVDSNTYMPVEVICAQALVNLQLSKEKVNNSIDEMGYTSNSTYYWVKVNSKIVNVLM